MPAARRTLLRAGALALALLANASLFAGLSAPAHAMPVLIQRNLPLVASNWFWYDQTNVGPVEGQSTSLTDETVPATDLPAAGPNAQDGGADKESYLVFDLSEAAADETLSSMVMRLPVDASSSAVQVAPPSTTPALKACLVTSTWSEGPGAQPWSTKPKDDCSVSAPGVLDTAKGVWTFTITALAQKWLDGAPNYGVAILPAVLGTGTPPSQVVMGPRTAVTATLATSGPEFVPSPEVVTPPPVATTPPPQVVVPPVVIPPIPPPVPAATTPPPTPVVESQQPVAAPSVPARVHPDGVLLALALAGVGALVGLSSLSVGARRRQLVT